MRSIIVFAAATLIATGVSAQAEPDHDTHHPGSSSSPAVAAKKGAKAKPASSAKAKTGTSAASAGPGMAGGMGNMKDMHEQMHKPGGVHDQMHGKDAKMMGGQMPGKPPASDLSK